MWMNKSLGQPLIIPAIPGVTVHPLEKLLFTKLHLWGEKGCRGNSLPQFSISITFETVNWPGPSGIRHSPIRPSIKARGCYQPWWQVRNWKDRKCASAPATTAWMACPMLLAQCFSLSANGVWLPPGSTPVWPGQGRSRREPHHIKAHPGAVAFILAKTEFSLRLGGPETSPPPDCHLGWLVGSPGFQSHLIRL